MTYDNDYGLHEMLHLALAINTILSFYLTRRVVAFEIKRNNWCSLLLHRCFSLHRTDQKHLALGDNYSRKLKISSSGILCLTR